MYIQKIRLLTDINLEAKPKRCFRKQWVFDEWLSTFKRIFAVDSHSHDLALMSEYSPDIIASLKHWSIISTVYENEYKDW